MQPRVGDLKVPFFSVIVPAYRQEKTIFKDLRRLKSVMDQLRYKYEIIVVVDGFVDKTYRNAKKVVSPKIKVVGYEHNRGKGNAIRYGMAKAKGDIVGFIDAGMDLDPKGIAIFLEDFRKKNADIVIGSKRHPLSKVSYPFKRRVISYFSQKFIKLLFGLDVTDTQVGMKFFKKSVIKKVLPRLLVKQFAFDVEILAVAYYLGYKKIYEAPIELTYNFDGSILSQNMARALWTSLWDTCAVFYRLKLIHYYDNNNKRKWRFDPELDIRINLP